MTSYRNILLVGAVLFGIAGSAQAAGDITIVRDLASRNASAAKALGAQLQLLASGVADADAVVLAVGWDAVEKTLNDLIA